MSLTYTKERRMCCRHSLFSFLLLNMFKKFVLMSVYHFIPGPTLRRLVPPLLPPLSGGSYLACGNKAKANNFFSFYSASSNRKIKFSIYNFFFFFVLILYEFLFRFAKHLTKFIDTTATWPYSGIISRTTELTARK